MMIVFDTARNKRLIGLRITTTRCVIGLWRFRLEFFFVYDLASFGVGKLEELCRTNEE